MYVLLTERSEVNTCRRIEARFWQNWRDIWSMECKGWFWASYIFWISTADMVTSENRFLNYSPSLIISHLLCEVQKTNHGFAQWPLSLNQISRGLPLRSLFPIFPSMFLLNFLQTLELRNVHPTQISGSSIFHPKYKCRSLRILRSKIRNKLK